MKEKDIKYGGAKIAIVIGSDSDIVPLYESGVLKLLASTGISVERHIISADRHSRELEEFIDGVNTNKITRVVIVAAGLSAQLITVASKIDVPVIGVPLSVGVFQGKDSLISMFCAPKGIARLICGPIGPDGLYNAGINALKILQYDWTMCPEAGIALKKLRIEASELKPSENNITNERIEEIYQKKKK